MRRLILLCVLGVCTALTLSAQAATYGGGSGTAADPYQIRTPEQMNTIGANPGDWASHFKLTADIDMSAYTGTQYNIIGNYPTYFTGTFDGDGHKIRNLTYMTTADVRDVGLFGYTWNATIKNVGVENVNLYTDGWHAGGLVGVQSSGIITNCTSTGSVTFSSPYSSCAGGLVGEQFEGTITHCTSTVSLTFFSYYPINSFSYAGGLVGKQDNGTIIDCTSTGSVTSSAYSSSYAGGLVGVQNFGTITDCTSTGPVTSSASSYSSSSYAGGLVGKQWDYCTITDCTSTGSVTSSASSYSYAGGLVGKQESSTITNCTSTGSVTSSVYYSSSYSANAGGLVGFSSGDSSISMCYSAGPVFARGQTVYKGGLLGQSSVATTACFWDTQTSGLTVGVGLGSSTGITGKTNVEMRTLSTFTDAGWDFTDTDGDAADWKMPATGYPVLVWKGCAEYPAGDINQDCKVDLADFALFAEQWMEGI